MGAKKINFSQMDLLNWRHVLEEKRKEMTQNEETLRKAMLSELSSESSGDHSRAPTHSAELASDNEGLNLLSSLSKKYLDSLYEIDFAMDRIDSGTFGICLGCGSGIHLERLVSLPESRYCRECAETEYQRLHSIKNKLRNSG